MKATLFFLGAFLCMLYSPQAVGQKLKADQYEISINDWEIRQTENFGQWQTDYHGTLKVKEPGRLCRRTYQFFFAEADGKLSHLTISTKKGDIMPPRLYFDDASKTFSVGSPTSTRIGTEQNNDLKELVLSGMLIWLRAQK
jgi:hypothetical protein